MSRSRQMSQAGLLGGLPFVFLLIFSLSVFVCRAGKEVERSIAFHEIPSTCIDLAHYHIKEKVLIVRFVNRDSERFYRYSNVPTKVWKDIQGLIEKGGVGTYFTETVVQHPEKYPFERIVLRTFTVIPRNKKAGDSK